MKGASRMMAARPTAKGPTNKPIYDELLVACSLAASVLPLSKLTMKELLDRMKSTHRARRSFASGR